MDKPEKRLAGASRIGPNLDTRGIGGFVVAPGSIVNGKAYAVRA